MAIDKIYTDGYTIITHFKTQSLTDSIREFQAVDGSSEFDPVIFNSYSTNSISSVISDTVASNTKFSDTLYSVLGTPKLSVFSDGYGNFIILNRDILKSEGAGSFDTDYGVNYSLHTYTDLLESSKGFTSATIVTDTNQEVSNNYYIIYPAKTGAVKSISVDLSLPYVDANGNQLIDCQNETDPDFGNTVKDTTIFKLGSLKGHVDSNFGEINADPIGSSQPFYTNFYYPDLDGTPQFKHIVIPVKVNPVPKNLDTVHLGAIVFDPDLDLFRFRFINDIDESSEFTYLKYSNGYNEDYKYLRPYSYIIENGIATPETSTQMFVCTFTGFSFSNPSNLEGLKATAFKTWNSTTNHFDISGEPPGSDWHSLYSQLPVEFGNRLFPLTDNTILNTIYRYGENEGTLTAWGESTDLEKNNNVGYFNIAYGTKHGFILMRLHSYAPILLSPSNPDGVEVHVPGGKWDYQAEDGTFPFQEAGGFTPISMAFSPDNNYLYTVVANPSDRTIRYICIYNMTNPDASAINSSAVIIENPFNALVKSVTQLPNGKMLFISDTGGEYTMTSGVADTESGVLSVGTTIESNYDFSVGHAYSLHSTANATNTWKGSNDPVPNTNVITLDATPSLDPYVLTPQGYLDVENIANGLTATEAFNSSNTDTWEHSVTITDAAKIPLVSAKTQIIDGSIHLEVFNPNTLESYYSDVLYDEYVSENFLSNPTSLSYVKLGSPANHYAIIIDYVEGNPIGEAFLGFYGPFKNIDQNSSFVGYTYSVVCIVDISDTSNLNIILPEDINNPSTGFFDPTAKYAIACSGFTATTETGLEAIDQTYGCKRFISLDGNDTYAIQLSNSDGDNGNNVNDIILDNNLRAGITILNISDTSNSQNSLTYDPETKTIDAFAARGATGQNLGFRLPDSFGVAGDTGGNEPTHSFSCVSHDATRLAAIFYNETAFSLNIINIDDNLNPSTILAIADVEFQNTMVEFLNLGDGYTITGAEFSANKKNLYLFCKGAIGYNIFKIEVGALTNPLFNSEGVHYEIPNSAKTTVSQYYYTQAIGQSDARPNFVLPLGVSAELLTDAAIQNSQATGMFKGLDNVIYLTNTNSTVLGRIVNADHVTGESNNITTHIKAGISLL